MGYAITNVGSTAVIKSVTETLPLFYNGLIPLTATYQVFYKNTVDVTNCDIFAYLIYASGARDVLIKLSMDAAQVFEDTINNGTHIYDNSNSIAGYTGSKTMKVELKGNGGTVNAANVGFWIQEA